MYTAEANCAGGLRKSNDNSDEFQWSHDILMGLSGYFMTWLTSCIHCYICLT